MRKSLVLIFSLLFYATSFAALTDGVVHKYYFNGPVNVEFIEDSTGSETVIGDELATGDLADDDPDMGIIPFDITDPNTYFFEGNFIHKTTDRDGEDGFALIPTGKFNNSIYYDGSRRDGDGDVQASLPGIAGEEQFTMSIWFKPNANLNPTWACLLSRSDQSGSQVGFLTALEPSATYAGRMSWSNRICGANFTVPAPSAENAQYDPIYYRDGQWNNLVISWDYTAGNPVDALNIWVNGNNVKDYLPSSEMVTYGVFETPGESWTYKLGADRYQWGRWYVGEMDELVFWDRNLSEAEIAELWNDGNGTNFEPIFAKAINPTPATNQTGVSPSTTALTWDYLDDESIQSIDSYEVYIANAPAFSEDPNLTNITPVVVTTASLPITIPSDIDYTYYWQVNTTYTNTDNEQKTVTGDIWNFETTGANAIPDLELPTAIVTSLDLMPASIEPTTYNNDDNAAFAWEYSPITEGVAIVDTSTAGTPSAELQGNIEGQYTVTLTVTDSASQIVSDSTIVKVALDKCAAAQLTAAWSGFNVFDIDDDCDVDLSDYAEMAVSWMDSIALDAPAAE